MQMAGNYKFKLEAISMNYRGIENEQPIEFNVLASSEKRQVY